MARRRATARLLARHAEQQRTVLGALAGRPVRVGEPEPATDVATAVLPAANRRHLVGERGWDPADRADPAAGTLAADLLGIGRDNSAAAVVPS